MIKKEAVFTVGNLKSFIADLPDEMLIYLPLRANGSFQADVLTKGCVQIGFIPSDQEHIFNDETFLEWRAYYVSEIESADIRKNYPNARKFNQKVLLLKP